MTATITSTAITSYTSTISLAVKMQATSELILNPYFAITYTDCSAETATSFWMCWVKEHLDRSSSVRTWKHRRLLLSRSSRIKRHTSTKVWWKCLFWTWWVCFHGVSFWISTNIQITQLNSKYDKNDDHHLLRLKDTFIHKQHLCLAFELLSVNLYELIKQNQFRGLSTTLVRVFAQQLLNALSLLNKAHLIHCDLKPENILLKK